MRITHAAFFSLGAALFLTLPRPVAAQTSGEAYYDFLISRHLEAAGDAKGAQAALEKGVAADPRSAEVRAELAAFFLRRDAAEDAERVAKEALQLDDANSEAHRVLGMLYAARSEDTGRGQAAQAAAADLVKQGIAHLERVTENPAGLTDLNLQYTLGRLYTRAGQADKAIQALTRVVNENPLSVQGRLALAQAYVAARDMNNAIEALREIVDDEPRVANMLGQFQEQAGKLKDAADSYTKALSVAPNSRELKVRRIRGAPRCEGVRTCGGFRRTGANTASRRSALSAAPRACAAAARRQRSRHRCAGASGAGESQRCDDAVGTRRSVQHCRQEERRGAHGQAAGGDRAGAMLTR
jgi:tetratricopeptide (TPR) repeat protein